MKQNKVLSLIGLAQKAGKVASGEFATAKAIKEGKAGFVFVSDEASDNTKKKFRNMCRFYGVPFHFYGTKTELGAAIGREFRASLAILDAGLSSVIEERLIEEDGGRRDGKNQGT